MQRDIFGVVSLTKTEAMAIQATADPNANAEPAQQAMAIRVIQEKLCNSDSLPYVEGKPDSTAFLNGRLFVSRGIEQIKTLNISELPSESKP